MALHPSHASFIRTIFHFQLAIWNSKNLSIWVSLRCPLKKNYFIIKVANQVEESEILPVFKAVEILKESCHAAAGVTAHFTTHKMLIAQNHITLNGAKLHFQ